MKHVDMVVIGSGPAGQKAAIQAAKLGKSVTLIERNRILGGACTHTGTIPSKALREAVLHLSGIQARGFYGDRNGSGRSKPNEITIEDLIARGQQVIRTEMEVIREHMTRNEVEIICGEARFEDPHTVRVTHQSSTEVIEADHVVIATGTVPARPANVPFDKVRVLDSDNLLELSHLPKSMIIVGGGVIGTEYACMMATLGVRVILTEARPALLDFVDAEISEALQYRMRAMGVTLRLGERVDEIRVQPDGLVQATLQSGKHLRADTLLYCIGRQGTTDRLGLENVGLVPDNRGRLKVNENYRPTSPTSTPSATSSASPPSPAPAWSRAGRPVATPTASRPRPSPSCSRWASTPSPRSPWSARPRPSSPPTTSPTRPASPSTARSRGASS